MEAADAAGRSPAQHVCDPGAWRVLAPNDVESSIGERFRAQVEAHPGCLAVKDGDEALTYAELDDWTVAIAGRLEGMGVTDGGRVVQLLHQGASSVAATLGTLVMGAIHVPLDPGEPEARLRALLGRVRPSALVTDEAGAARLARLGVEVPVILADDRHSPQPPVPRAVAPEALATIYLTSGSTGAPKGVVDSHRNIVHNALRYTVGLGVTPADRLSLVQSPSSSAVMSSIFAALLNGAALFPYRLDVVGIGALASWVRDERITVYHSVPSILRRALAFGGLLPDVRVVRLEGDRSLGQDMATWRRHFPPGARVANGLGTTETGLCRQLVVPVETPMADGIMPVGYAVTDMEASVVDGTGAPVATGEVGEIAIASRYLAIGYLDDETLTAAAFGAADPEGVRTYRTGDLGRLREDGCLEYLGRSDAQSKVLGHRVEPAEVEAALAAIQGVEAVAIRVVDDGAGEGRVVAWVVAGSGTDDATLRAGAAARLPAHMRPVRYVRVATLPVAASGKVDRAALAEPTAPELTASPGPTDPLEAQVLTVVRQVLGHAVGRDDDFFASGGDSLGALDVVLSLEGVVGRRLPPSLLLGAPTVARLAEVLGQDQSHGAPIHGAPSYGAPDGAPAQGAPAQGAPTLVMLAASGAGTPLVLVPSHHGHPLAYAALARHLDGVRPVLATDVSTTDGSVAGFDEIAARHVEAILAARLRGPYLLGGFCFGGAMACELARRLADVGDPPAGIYLLGVSPYDLPDLVPAADLGRWERSVTRRGMARRAIRFGAELVGPVGRQYLADRARHEALSLRELASGDGRQRRGARRRRDAETPPASGRYRGPALALPVALILPARSAAAYTDDPGSTFADVARSVAVHVVPGVERMLLREPVVSEVARLMAIDPG
ncbi:MAG: AMP-binding protein [Chloroflexota bacterium]